MSTAARGNPYTASMAVMAVKMPSANLRSLGGKFPNLAQVLHHFARQSSRIAAACLEMKLRTQRRLIRIAYPREVRDLAGPGFLVQPFGIARFADFQRS